MISTLIDDLKVCFHLLSRNKQSNYFTEIREILSEKRALQYFNNSIHFFDDGFDMIKNLDGKKNIWQLWSQGIESAPLLVRRCMASVEAHSKERNVIILSEKSLQHYASIPGYIFDKKKKGIISQAQFSDIVRAHLLDAHGGTWIDATVFLTDNIDSFLEKDFFCFSVTPKALLGYSEILASSWFIHVGEPSTILRAVKKMLNEFWKQENKCIHYYTFHLLFSLCVKRNKLCASEWSQVPFFSGVPCHALQMDLFKPFDKARFNEIREMTPIHKLTSYGGNEYKTDVNGTFFDVITNSKHDSIFF